MKFCKTKIILLVTAIICLSVLSCASTSVKRVSADTVTDISEYWNDTDVEIVCNSLVKQFVESDDFLDYADAKGIERPTIEIDNFKNASSERIDVTVITDKMRSQIRRNSNVKFVAAINSGTASNLQQAAAAQQDHASEDTAARMDEAIGADLQLSGSVKTVIQTEGNTQVRVYYVTAEVWDITTGELIWDGQNSEIKKIVKKAKAKL
jgi:PBP1b-binding outer membrane lipoprotein LpoB